MDKSISKLTDVKVDRSYSALFPPAQPVIPIPFFGHIEAAKVVTVGLNPSSEEIKAGFADGYWHEAMTAKAANGRLTEYFEYARHPFHRPHPWFDTWERALNIIGASYLDGTAVHVDLCPWATYSASKLEAMGFGKDFEDLVKDSLPGFWNTLASAHNAKLVLMAGAVSKRFYIHEFLKRYATGNDHIEGVVTRGGQAFVNELKLIVSGQEIPCLYTSCSPSSRKKEQLPQRIAEYGANLQRLLGA